MPSREEHVEKWGKVVWGKVGASREKDFETVTQTLLENYRKETMFKLWRISMPPKSDMMTPAWKMSFIFLERTVLTKGPLYRMICTKSG